MFVNLIAFMGENFIPECVGRKMKIRLDLHVHTKYSHDCSTDPNAAVAYARKIGLDGIAITDHDEIGWKKIDEKFIVIPGIEISTKRGHLIALGIDRTIEKGLSVEETIEKVKDLGGITIMPHPFRFVHGIRPSAHESFEVDGVEVSNGKDSKRLNRKAKRLARRWDKAEVAGSDAHRLEEIGSAVTILEVSEPKLDEILQSIQEKRSGVLI